MANAYSKDLRIRSIELVRKGREIDEVVRLLKISRATLYRGLQKEKHDESLVPKKIGKSDITPKSQISKHSNHLLMKTKVLQA